MSKVSTHHELLDVINDDVKLPNFHDNLPDNITPFNVNRPDID